MRRAGQAGRAKVAGFTLVETLVASGILVLVLAGVVTAFVFGVSAVSRATADGERLKAVNKVAGRFQQSVENASSAKVRNNGTKLELTGESPGQGKTKVALYTEKGGTGGGGWRLLLSRKQEEPLLLAEGISDGAVFVVQDSYARIVVKLEGEGDGYELRTGSLLAGPTPAEQAALERARDKGKDNGKDDDGGEKTKGKTGW